VANCDWYLLRKQYQTTLDYDRLHASKSDNNNNNNNSNNNNNNNNNNNSTHQLLIFNKYHLLNTNNSALTSDTINTASLYWSSSSSSSSSSGPAAVLSYNSAELQALKRRIKPLPTISTCRDKRKVKTAVWNNITTVGIMFWTSSVLIGLLSMSYQLLVPSDS
jgi:hypothetical protein